MTLMTAKLKGLAFAVLTFLAAIPASAQEEGAFDGLMRKYDMTFTPNDRFDIIHKGEYHRIFDTDTCHALPRVMLSMDSKDGKCRVCMYVNPMIPMMYDGKGEKLTADYSSGKTARPAGETLWELKAVLRGGHVASSSVSKKWEEDNLVSMMTFLSSSKARRMFNSDFLAWIPLDLREKVYEGKYTNARYVVTGRHGDDILLLFFMTDDGAEHFDKYLEDMKGMFRFK